MKVISLVSQKGGAGKTTLAINLAVAAARENLATALIDVDPQASATSWSDIREAEDPTVISCQAQRLDKVLAAAEQNGADLVVIDTAPHSESISLKVAKASNLVLVPCKPAFLDLKAISNTVDILKLAGTPGAILLNAIPTKSLAFEAEVAVKSFELALTPKIFQRIAFMHSLTAGESVQEWEPTGKAANEIRLLWNWVKAELALGGTSAKAA